MKTVWLLSVCLLVLSLSGLVGCSSELERQLDTYQSNYYRVEEELATLQSDYEDLQLDYNRVEEELEELVPPGGFSSVLELDSWASLNSQPKTPYVEGSFRSALKIQSLGLLEGYLINVSVYTGETERYYVVSCSTLVEDQLYCWYPEEYDGVYPFEGFTSEESW